MAPPVLNEPFWLEYLAFVVAWKTGQAAKIETTLKYFLTHEPRPYSDENYIPIMKRKEYKIIGLAYFIKEWMVPLFKDFLKIKSSEKKCWTCYLPFY